MPILKLTYLSQNTYQIDASCFKKSSEINDNVHSPIIQWFVVIKMSFVV